MGPSLQSPPLPVSAHRLFRLLAAGGTGCRASLTRNSVLPLHNPTKTWTVRGSCLPPPPALPWLVQWLDGGRASESLPVRFPEHPKPWGSESRHGQTPCAGNRQGREVAPGIELLCAPCLKPSDTLRRWGHGPGADQTKTKPLPTHKHHHRKSGTEVSAGVCSSAHEVHALVAPSPGPRAPCPWP